MSVSNTQSSSNALSVSAISPYENLIVVNGRFDQPFNAKNGKQYTNFIFEGGKFLLEMPSGVVPGQRGRATFVADFNVHILNSGKTSDSFRPTRFLAFDLSK